MRKNIIILTYMRLPLVKAVRTFGFYTLWAL